MQILKIRKVLVSIILLVFPFLLNSQPVWIQKIESPVVHSDRTVTFYYKAPNASKVELSAQFINGLQSLSKDSVGVWSITLGPVTPDIYPYNFIVDGISVSDPNNTNIFPNERFKCSILEVQGEKPLISSLQDVPHGEITYCYYSSKSMKVTRPMLVYTPPGYKKSDKKYPVLYLVSGTTDTEETWFKVGRANFILDNLIAQNKAVPMIIVMPYGNMLTGTPDPSSLKAAEMYKVFNDDIVGSIIPFVDESYRTIPDRENRAIAGFSRGGGQSLFTGFTNTDKFAWIGSYSAYLTPEVFEKYFGSFSANPEELNQKLSLLWLGVGTDDFLYKPATTFIDLLKQKNINQKNRITSGGHTWMNARLYLTETLQLYFKK